MVCSHLFCREGGGGLISCCHWKTLENPCNILLVKGKTRKRIFNTNSELLQNRIEKQIMPFKRTVNWLFNDIWCYLVIGCFEGKLAFSTNSSKGFILSLIDCVFVYPYYCILVIVSLIDMKNVRRSQTCISVNFCFEFSKS